jgi:3-phosphoshikimate 1-carboxyvinyltransferase
MSSHPGRAIGCGTAGPGVATRDAPGPAAAPLRIGAIVRTVMHGQHAIQSVAPARRVRGPVSLPGDKSISHRYALLASLAQGVTSITRFAPGADCNSTLRCLSKLGVPVVREAGSVRIEGRDLRGLWIPDGPLDCGNSGSTLRMLAGVLAAHPFDVTLTGDASLRRRPMRRVITPLERMGATLHAANDRPPLTVRGGPLRGIDYEPPVPSAQVKSAVLLAGLQAEGETTVTETVRTRDHTERALQAFGAEVVIDGVGIHLAGGQHLTGGTFEVPGDISSAAFWAVAAAGLPGSSVELRGVGLNPSRTALLDVLRRAGAIVESDGSRLEAGEPVGTLTVRNGELRPLTIAPDEVPALIDELPALAALATFGGGIVVTGAGELRTKESDRITALVNGLRSLGTDAEELPDGFAVKAGQRIEGGTADACDDHRLAMAFAIAALGAGRPSTIVGAASVAVSYPEFFDVLETLRG